MDRWSQLGDHPPRQLSAARLDMHHAAQPVAIAVGRALIPHRDDDSHTTLTWLHDAGQWVGEPIPNTPNLRAGLRPTDLVLTLGTVDAPAAQHFALIGQRRQDALGWLRNGLGAHGVDPASVVFDPHYDMPDHPVANGAPWDDVRTAERLELTGYFAAASAVLVDVVDAQSNAPLSPVLTWPHHFDVGALLEHGDDSSRSIGIGLSPGDGHYDEPYFYVSPYPGPEGIDLPLPAGHWHEAPRFKGAVLTATELLTADDRDATARTFLDAAIAAARTLLDR